MKPFLPHSPVPAWPSSGWHEPADRVWVLTGSIGALTAARRFFHCLAGDLPVAFVIAIRIPHDGLPLAVKLLARETGYRVYGTERGRTLCRQDIVIAPADEPLQLSPAGRLEIPAAGGREVPATIDGTLRAVAQRYRDRAGVIVLSGIGTEGVQGCQAILDHGGEVWMQDPESCQFTSLPDHARGVCNVSYCGAPELLAKQLSARLAQHDDHRGRRGFGPHGASSTPVDWRKVPR